MSIMDKLKVGWLTCRLLLPIVCSAIVLLLAVGMVLGAADSPSLGPTGDKHMVAADGYADVGEATENSTFTFGVKYTESTNGNQPGELWLRGLPSVYGDVQIASGGTINLRFYSSISGGYGLGIWVVDSGAPGFKDGVDIFVRLSRVRHGFYGAVDCGYRTFDKLYFWARALQGDPTTTPPTPPKEVETPYFSVKACCSQRAELMPVDSSYQYHVGGLEVTPIDPSYEDDGTGSCVYTFRVKYSHFLGRPPGMPHPDDPAAAMDYYLYAPGGERYGFPVDEWQGLGNWLAGFHRTGVVLYIWEDPDGDGGAYTPQYRPHFMVLDPDFPGNPASIEAATADNWRNGVVFKYTVRPTWYKWVSTGGVWGYGCSNWGDAQPVGEQYGNAYIAFGKTPEQLDSYGNPMGGRGPKNAMNSVADAINNHKYFFTCTDDFRPWDEDMDGVQFYDSADKGGGNGWPTCYIWGIGLDQGDYYFVTAPPYNFGQVWPNLPSPWYEVLGMGTLNHFGDGGPPEPIYSEVGDDRPYHWDNPNQRYRPYVNVALSWGGVTDELTPPGSKTGVETDEGVVTALTATTITDNIKNWTPGNLVGQSLLIKTQTVWRFYIIASNTNNTIYIVSGNLLTDGVAVGDTYKIEKNRTWNAWNPNYSDAWTGSNIPWWYYPYLEPFSDTAPDEQSAYLYPLYYAENGLSFHTRTRGSDTTKWTFWVVYTNAKNIAPQRVRVNIDG